MYISYYDKSTINNVMANNLPTEKKITAISILGHYRFFLAKLTQNTDLP